MYSDWKGYFDRVMEEWRQFYCDFNDFIQWIIEVEELLVDICVLGGSLDLEKVRIYQQEFEEGISSYWFSFVVLNRIGDGIVQKFFQVDGSFLKDKLVGLN